MQRCDEAAELDGFKYSVMAIRPFRWGTPVVRSVEALSLRMQFRFGSIAILRYDVMMPGPC